MCSWITQPKPASHGELERLSWQLLPPVYNCEDHCSDGSIFQPGLTGETSGPHPRPDCERSQWERRSRKLYSRNFLIIAKSKAVRKWDSNAWVHTLQTPRESPSAGSNAAWANAGFTASVFNLA